MSETKRYQLRDRFVDAVQWDESLKTLDLLRGRGLDWCGHQGHRDNPDLCRSLRVKTPTQDYVDVDHGDWFVRDARGRFVVLNPEEFASAFEPKGDHPAELLRDVRAVLTESIPLIQNTKQPSVPAGTVPPHIWTLHKIDGLVSRLPHEGATP